MKIGIIGAGSIGLLTGAYLGKDHQVHMFVRNQQQKNRLEKDGIVCDALQNPTRVEAHYTEEVKAGFDLWIITVKQHQLEQVMNLDFPHNVPLLFLQNGMGHLDMLSRSPYTCWVGVVEHGALKQGHNSVSHTGKGNVQIARISDEEESALPKVVDVLHKENFPIFLQEDYEKMLASKLLVNTVINPVTALFQLKNGSIVNNPHIQTIARELCREACGILDFSFAEEWERVKMIAEKTALNQSSMLKDLIENRVTEIDAINGYVLRRSSDPLPYHQFIVHAIHAIEHEKGVRNYE
ncbi:2-dehydropantoate 2-reductase [Halobacillus litoralis]|uniref:2-dehydropantoate 2-reductase n=1 Tax=Halobacillus litoralis TaxID=45668 RepID=A0A410M8S1_9BACI|nr:2-dehydropantoate 2-reductase [Halobacillus litoralis]QAS51107.1 2-dehydropantoate 2-reductase [Halobacillus litoralis]